MSNSRAFKVRTQEGSLFVGRLEDEYIQDGLAFYKQTWLGYSERKHQKLKILGIGCVPMVGGEIVVDQVPYETYMLGDEEIPVYHTETIISADELPLPEVGEPETPEEIPRDP